MSEVNTDVHNALNAFGGVPLRYRTFRLATARLETVRDDEKTPTLESPDIDVAVPPVRRTTPSAPASTALLRRSATPQTEAVRATTPTLADIFRILSSHQLHDVVAAS